MSSSTLDGHRALVTGASQNLGRHLATHLAGAGATVAIGANTSREAAEELAEELGARTGREHPVVTADLGEVGGAESLASQAHDALGGVDILVNNAGPFSITPLVEVPAEEWRRTLESNLTASLLLARSFMPAMAEAGWGRVVNLSAGSAFVRNHATYGLVKDAVGALTESLALEAGPGVTVNAVAPGQIEESAPEVSAIDPTFVERALARTPTQRMVRRDEVAEVVLALCQPMFSQLTGAVLPLDGGWRLPRF